MKQAGKTLDKIAKTIGFGQSTVSKKLSRNPSERGHRSSQAERMAETGKSQKRTRPKVVVGIIKVDALSGWRSRVLG